MTFKEIIFTGIEDRLDKENIKSLLFTYDVFTKNTFVYATNNLTDETLKIDFTKSENLIIKRMLINKIVRQSKKEYSDKILNQIIVNINNNIKELNIYLQFDNENLIKL